MNIGQRVKVSIPSNMRSGYAVGAADALDGMEGSIETIGAFRILVRFDKPAPKWWTHQSPVTAHWFEEKELAVLP